ncbi:MAG: lipoprotein LpqH [Actinomycetota bacterium]|nr:lipoprotein LpqH [Actinomycetota bacterium]
MAADVDTTDRKLSDESLVKRRRAAALVLVVLATGGCSSVAGQGQSEQLPPGTAQLSVRGEDAAVVEAANCVPNKHLTMITIGDGPPVAVAMISSTDRLAVEWVRLHDVAGFSGSYNDGLGGEADVTLVGATYQISGVADGFDNENPSRPTTETFAIDVSC